jgi:ATP diphosphatase
MTANWEAIKAAERAGKSPDASALADVAVALPALMRSHKLQKRAARTGFDWPDIEGAIDKVNEEIDEIRASSTDAERFEEAGDLVFAAVNVCRLAGVDAEEALKAANRKFERRFRSMEALAEGRFEQLDLESKEALWQRVKTTEKT